MAKSNVLNFTQALKAAFNTIVAEDTTALKTICTGGTNDSVVKSLMAISDDTSARVLNVYINNGSSDFLIGSVNIPLASGTNGTTTGVDLLSGSLFPGLPYDSNGKRVLPLPAGFIIKVSSQTTITAAKTVTITALLEDY